MANWRGAHGSQFWKGLQKVKMKFEWGAVFKVNNGKKTKFWENIWIKDTKLKEAFPRLYNYFRDKEAMVSNCWDREEWSINFRSFGEEEVKE